MTYIWFMAGVGVGAAVGAAAAWWAWLYIKLNAADDDARSEVDS
jgi:hypothetical protein